MNSILLKQQFLQRSFGNDNNDLTVGDVCTDILAMKEYLGQEITELVEEVAGSRTILKPWKKGYTDLYEQPFISTDKVKEEAIDALCFAMNICLLAGITPDNVDEEYSKVFNKNINRIKIGY